MERMVEVGILFDYYGGLLSEKQQDMIRQYYEEDLSLNEIAQINNISKQAVSTTLKRAVQKLEGYEKNLGLIERFCAIQKKVLQIKSHLPQTRCSDSVQGTWAEVTRLCDEVIDIIGK